MKQTVATPQSNKQAVGQDTIRPFHNVNVPEAELTEFNTDRTYPGRWTITFSNPPINMFVPTTIVELRKLGSATKGAANRELVFLSLSWSRCPAEKWVPALSEGVWTRVSATLHESQRSPS